MNRAFAIPKNVLFAEVRGYRASSSWCKLSQAGMGRGVILRIPSWTSIQCREDARWLNAARWGSGSLYQQALSSQNRGFGDSTAGAVDGKGRISPVSLVHEAGERQIDRVEKAMRGIESENEIFTVRRQGLQVFVDLAPGIGTYWVQYDRDLRQICLLSPRSGAYRYLFDATTGRWIGEVDNHDFEGMLTRDLIQQVYGIPNFDAE